MARDDWFRRTSWSAQDRAEFFARLGRSRGTFHRSQYLRIQALHLQQTGDPVLMTAALELLDTLFAEYPERSQLALAHKQRAEILATFGRFDEAVAAYRDSFAAERALSNVHSGSYLGFAELVVTAERVDLYDEVVARIAEFGDAEPFPVMRYQRHLALALIAEHRGQLAEARHHAQLALDAAAATESPFRHHRTLGLVREQHAATHARLLALVSRTH